MGIITLTNPTKTNLGIQQGPAYTCSSATVMWTSIRPRAHVHLSDVFAGRYLGNSTRNIVENAKKKRINILFLWDCMGIFEDLSCELYYLAPSCFGLISWSFPYALWIKKPFWIGEISSGWYDPRVSRCALWHPHANSHPTCRLKKTLPTGSRD